MLQQDALVIATYSRRMRLRLDSGDEVDARIKGKRIKPVCGDRVNVEPIKGEDDWLITAIGERTNALTRPNQHGQTEVLAANIEFLAAVAANTPEPDWFVIDRYLSAAENMGIAACVVYNKTDLNTGDESVDDALSDYEQVGYATVRCSARTRENLDDLAGLLKDRIAIIVGQSGVGKSSIINALTGKQRQRTAEISAKSREGRHTTVNSIMLHLPDGGQVIDSPGVRDYAPALETGPEVIRGFREIEMAGHDCRFANCRHLQEPGCAVKAAVDGGRISGRRYASYKRSLSILSRRPT